MTSDIFFQSFKYYFFFHVCLNSKVDFTLYEKSFGTTFSFVVLNFKFINKKVEIKNKIYSFKFKGDYCSNIIFFYSTIW